MDRSTVNEAVFDEGYEAGYFGQPSTDNKYVEPDLRISWYNGWQLGFDMLSRARGEPDCNTTG
jgi:ribosome modulation factor